jgi:ABC-type glycerol-3-phosphate transport system substrate-binding protein
MVYDSMLLPKKSLFTTEPVRVAIDYLYRMIAVEKVATLTYSKYDMQFNNVGFNVTDGPGEVGPVAYDITLPPKGPANRASRVNPDGFQILKYSKNKEAAWQWVKFLVASPENQIEMSKITGKLPSLKEAMLKWPKYMTNLPQNWYAYIETSFSPDGYPGYVVPEATTIDPIVNNNLAKVWSGSVAPEVALQQIQDQVAAILGK